MTAKEAIDILWRYDVNFEPHPAEEVMHAIDMAIEVLKYSEIPNSSDTISRQAAIDALHMHLMYRMGTDSNKKRLDEWINNLPSAQPERKKGRWIHDGYAFKGGIDWMHCSECGHKDSWSAATRTPFCAWCGARMEGES